MRVIPPTLGELTVCGLSQARRHKRAFGAVITVEDPGARPAQRLRFTRKPAPAHLVLAFEDVDDDTLGIRVAAAEQVADALAFANKHKDAALLVHCFHGVGRSAAIALAILADRFGPGAETDAVDRLLALRPEATPNLVVVALADRLLARNGALRAAVSKWEASAPHMPQVREARRRLVLDRPELYARL
ncbi:hypothetical protein [Brevundimonas sp.]|uniref:tyrosine phosphatase family protein n=1 Tax=Brevundimonas sp. TaxID=1871086 RepID=UPI0011F4EA8B|nr:hypothetical protein [Brevundimonas sp.]TAJ63225.1 MAG: tyrosine protein phosphatase [Brevundimonas sp.]